MTSYANTDNQTANEQPHLEEVMFVEMDLPSGWLRLHTRIGNIVWGGNTYLGVGQFGELGDIDEDAMLRPSGVAVTLTGVDSSVITAAKDEACFGRHIAIYRGMLNLSTMQLIADPELEFKGLLDTFTCTLGANTGSIVAQCEGELARWQRHNNSLLTHESQQALFPGDRGFDQIQFTQNRKIDWRKGNVWQGSSQVLRRTNATRIGPR